jgi:transposase InsO family protein
MSRQTDAGIATIRLLCALFGISRAAYYAARRLVAAASSVARRGGRQAATPTEPLLAAIRAVLVREPAWGVRKVWATLRRDGLVASRKRVWALMKAHGLVLARDREPGETTRGHVAVPEPNRRLATDLTTVWTKRDGVVAIVPTIDCGCRSVLAITVTTDQTSPMVLASVDLACERAFGRPENVPDGVELRTDHGPQYTGADCEQLVQTWRLQHTYAPVGRPTGNAVVERVIRTLKEEVIWLQDWEDAAQVRAAVEAWQVRYNTQRPHQALDWQTPEEYRRAHLQPPLSFAA